MRVGAGIRPMARNRALGEGRVNGGSRRADRDKSAGPRPSYAPGNYTPSGGAKHCTRPWYIHRIGVPVGFALRVIFSSGTAIQ